MTTTVDDLTSKIEHCQISYIRPKIRNFPKNRAKSMLYTKEELDSMKGTFIGDIINDIYNQKPISKAVQDSSRHSKTSYKNIKRTYKNR